MLGVPWVGEDIVTSEQAQELAELIDELAKRRAWLAADEVAGDYEMGGEPRGIADTKARLAKLLESLHAG